MVSNFLGFFHVELYSFLVHVDKFVVKFVYKFVYNTLDVNWTSTSYVAARYMTVEDRALHSVENIVSMQFDSNDVIFTRCILVHT